ncbi:MAG TPA: MEDS domain-containing protein [Polyangiaceae bacterium]|nr:MEDS domain-containing protein [Polyangiaceae bacterium]
MSTELRRSGIQGMTDVPWGTHFCQFYGTKLDLIDSLVPYFEAGLASNEQCIWVTSRPLPAAEGHELLSARVPHLDALIDRGQIEIIDYHDWYSRSGELDAEATLKAWMDRHDQALARGYDGLRITGNTSFLERSAFKAFADYERRVNERFRGERVLALCSYSLNDCEPESLLEVLRNHRFALVRRDGEWDIIESAALTLAREELQRVNKELHILNLHLEERVSERTRELEEALKVREEFLSIASHELKTPLAALKLQLDGLLRGLRGGRLSLDEVTRRVARAEAQCGRLDALATNLLEASVATSGRMTLDPASIDLAELACEAVARFGEQLVRAGSQVRLTATAPVRGSWDRLRLEQVITNLLSNALKHAPGTLIEVRVEVIGREAVLTVRDHGPGVSSADRDRIFERYTQAAPGKSAGGFGLGLWITRHIVEALGGSIELDSELGRGASFKVRLPRAPTSE